MKIVPSYWKDARSKSGKIGIKFLTFPIWKEICLHKKKSQVHKSHHFIPNFRLKKPARQNWDLIKAFGCCNCSTTQQLTHWYYLLSFLFLFPLYVFIIFSFFKLCFGKKKNNVNFLSSNFFTFQIIPYFYLMCFTTHCVNRVSITRRIELGNRAIGFSSLYRYSIPF